MPASIVHIPTPTGGNPSGLSRALSLLGASSKVWVLFENPFGYHVDKVIGCASDGFILRQFKKLISLRYIAKCDVVFFNYGSGVYNPFPVISREVVDRVPAAVLIVYEKYSRFFAVIETGFLRLLGKPIFIQYQGDDARQGDFCARNFAITHAKYLSYNFPKWADDSRRRCIEFYAKRATKIYALNPDLLWVLPSNAEFLPYSHVDLAAWTPLYTQERDRPLRIVHAPTNRAIKGTDVLIEAIDELKRQGYQFEFTLVEGVAQSVARSCYEAADVIIDQLLVGWYGGLAVEAMALGKPVVSYIRREDLRFVPAEMAAELPILTAEPATIGAVLEKILRMPRSELARIARASRAYVERWHDPLVIGRRVMSDIDRALTCKH